MRIKVELHPDVVWFVKFRCNAEEQDAFYRQLDKVRQQPIKSSRWHDAPDVSRYVLRFFRFKGNVALFEYDVARSWMRVLECRRIPPQ